MTDNPDGVAGHLRIRADKEALQNVAGWRIGAECNGSQGVMKHTYSAPSCFVAVLEKTLHLETVPQLVLKKTSDDVADVEILAIDVGEVLRRDEEVVQKQFEASGLTVWVHYFENGQLMNP